MKEREQRNLIYDIKEFLKNFFSSRLFVLFIVMVLLFGTILARVFSLQIVNGSMYEEKFTQQIEKKLSIEASRGNIYDCNGKLLAFNKLAYSVTISDTGSYRNNKTRNKLLNAELSQIIDVLKKHGETIYNNFPIEITEDGGYEYTISGTTLNRFLADAFGRTSFDLLKYNKTINCNEQDATAEQIMQYFCSSESECFDVADTYSKEKQYEIVALRYAIRENRFSKYKTTTIAKDVSDETVAYMNEHSDELTGIAIVEDTIRKYNDSEYFASIIGYTGKISIDELTEYEKEDKTYTQNDTVGKAGLEQYYEKYLRGVNGEEEIYVNNVGKPTDVISRTDPVAGNNLYLSIDADVQKNSYRLLEQEIAGVLYTNIKKNQIPINDVYFGLINNNVVDLEHFSESDASSTEKRVYKSFKNAQKSSVGKVKGQLSSSSTILRNMSEEMLDYITYVISMLKNDNVLLTSKIDMNDSTYNKWRNNNLSPKEYLKYCVAQQWIDITLLDVDQKYADTSEIYDALCDYILTKIKSDKEFSKIVYEYMIKAGQVTGQQLCIILFDQGVLDYDDNTVNNLKSGVTSPYSFMLEKINNIEITPAQLALDPCTGSCIITDVKTGEIKALVSYPGYDNNRLANGVDAAYYQALQEDKSKPLWNYATQEQTAPGSTFKMVSATAGLAEGVLASVNTEIDCNGVFTKVSNKPKCWIASKGGSHGKINVSEAIRDSCNVFFYSVGWKLSNKGNEEYDDATGISYIQKYASAYGLNKKTGLEIVENTPKIATQYPVMAAIGQADNNLTTASLSRYVTAVTSGKLYDYQLMNKIVDTDGNVIEKYKPSYETVNDLLNSTQWNAIHSGMRMVCESLKCFDDLSIKVAGKTGTAQQNNRPDHGLFVGYAPYNNPDISIAVRIANGYSSHNAAAAARNIISCYYKKQSLDELLALKAAGANSESNNSVAD